LRLLLGEEPVPYFILPVPYLLMIAPELGREAVGETKKKARP
jgi:hypothetical protein